MEKSKTFKNNNKEETRRPLVISASRATDIPAFFAQWFLERLREGFVNRVNPYQKRLKIEFDRVRAVIFWTKNPAPMLPHLQEIIDRRLTPVFLFTLNDYEQEGWEPKLPPLSRRLETFIRLSERLPPGSVAWRFDPIALNESLTPEVVLKRLENIHRQIAFSTEKLIFSFIYMYPKVRRRLLRYGLDLRAPTPEEKKIILKGLTEIKDRSRAPLRLCGCAEDEDMGPYGIEANSCVDAHLLARLNPELNNSPELFSRPKAASLFAQSDLSPLKDKGQRRHCRCAPSQDIGAYNTCAHGCVYCYANR